MSKFLEALQNLKETMNQSLKYGSTVAHTHTAIKCINLDEDVYKCECGMVVYYDGTEVTT